MTLDEAIEKYETMAEGLAMKAGFETDNPTYAMAESERKEYEASAKEYRQLAEWRKELKQLRKIAPQPKKGKWIRVDKDKCKCDQCEVIAFIGLYPNGDKNYYPNCGAKMQEVQK